MRLFVDRLPFETWTDRSRNSSQQHWSVVLPILLSSRGAVAPPPNLAAQAWVFDIGYRGEAFAWRRHLLRAGLDPDMERSSHRASITTALRGKNKVPVRQADLWLVSNRPEFQGTPLHLPTFHGICFLDVPNLPDPHFHRPLLGLYLLQQAKLEVDLDLAGNTVTVWAPDLP